MRRGGTRKTPSITIIGGGFGGIAAAVKLRRAGITTFTIFEQSDGIGGTWWDNIYPGAEVDVGSHLYSYSFRRHDWSRTHARQAELQQYLEDVVDHFGLRPHFRLGTVVTGARWDEETHRYAVTLADGETFESQVVISAVGLLNVPRYPDWPGLEEFAGAKFHTFRWEHQHDLTGKRVALVGTGSTASQVLPAIAPIAGHVTLFQREPGWVIPKGDRDFTNEERVGFSGRLAYRRERLRLLWQIERGQIRGSIHRPGTKVNTLREQQCRSYIDHVFKDRPDLREMVTPAYPYPGKRPVLTGNFYPALLRDNVDLVPDAVTSVTPHGVVDAAGVEHPADVLVMATGFQPTNYLSTLDIVGRGGTSLREFWQGEPTAFLGITVPGFPNFFMLYGPNTNGGEIVSHLERQSEYVVRAVRRLSRGDATAVEVRQLPYRLFNRWLQRSMTKTAWVVSNNYYKAPSGRVVTQWPYGTLLYGALTKFLGGISESTRTRTEPSRATEGRGT
jgi:cation diffusion facilitator CzcD-associated flavoprotein CzcO